MTTEHYGSAAARIADQLCQKGESLVFENKRVSGKMVGKALETICAFANTEGGILALGMEDISKSAGRAHLIGIEENPEAVDEFQRKLRTHFVPAIEGINLTTLHVTLGNGSSGRVVLARVPQSAKVHSIVDDGTWIRLPSSNREMSVDEITALSFRRGVISAETELVDVPLELLDTESWKTYGRTRNLRAGEISEVMQRLGLAKRVGNAVRPTKAAVLLFAEYPSELLAAYGSTRAGIRVLHYVGTTVEHGPDTDLKKPPKTVAGPVVEQIAAALDYVKNEIAQRLVMARSGFATVHRYPERVIKEAITNAVLHRDYRFGKDIQIRIFENRIEVESPGEFPGNITPATISTAKSSPRNPSLVNHAREFPNPPNVDAGEGIPMMFQQMKAQGLFPPQYSVSRDAAVPSVTVTLLNEARPPVWEQVSDWIDKHGYIANRDLRKIAAVETLDASRMLKRWVESGLLISDDTKGKRGTVYRKGTTKEWANALGFDLPEPGEQP